MNDTIKMFIAGEEVVSDREFTINEEMLSASSTILNNCYPKSWELTKDYVSNFYYPKDYSKFVLSKGNYTHGNDEYGVVRGYSGNYTTNVEKEWNNFAIGGDTLQDTTPIGKNLLCFGNVSNALGLTITKTNNSQIRITGTSNAAGVISLPLSYSPTLTSQPYTLSITMSGTVNKTITGGLPQSATLYGLSMTAQYTERTSTNENGRTMQYFQIEVPQTSSTFTNFVVQVQLEQNWQATAFENFIPPTPNPSEPKEFTSVGYQNLFDKNTENVLNAYINGSSVITASSPDRSYWLPIKRNTNYTIKMTQIAISTSAYVDDFQAGLFTTTPAISVSGSRVFSKVRASATEDYTFTETFNSGNYDYLVIKVGNNTRTKIQESLETLQLEEGTQAHSYIPYGKYGIEIVNTGKNLFNTKEVIQKANSTYQIISNNEIIVSSTSGSYRYSQVNIYNLNKNTNYTFSAKYSSSNSGAGNLWISVWDNPITTTLYNNSFISGNKITFNSGEHNSVAIGIYSTGSTNVSNNATWYDIQLEQGSTATDFEAYKSNTQLYVLDEPLRKIGIIADLLYVSNNNLILRRNIGRLLFNGTENWVLQSTNSFGIANFLLTSPFTYPIYVAQKDNFLSNYFLSQTSGISSTTSPGILIANATSLYIRIPSSTANNASNFKTWLNSHNTEILYLMNSYVEENLGTINLPTAYDGINNYTIYTGEADNGGKSIYYYWKNYDVLFAGVVKNSGDISLNPRYPHSCSLQILDYKTFLSESDTLDFVISNKTIAEAIQMVVEAVSGYGFIVGNIDINQANDIIGAYSTLNKTAYDVLQYLANISGSRWRARYIDSSTTAIDFYDPDLLPQASDIEYTKEYWEQNNIVDLTFNYGTRDYRNKQVMLSNEVYASINYTEVLLSNGYNTNFITQNNVGGIVQISINGVEASFITQEERELGVDADFYYTPGKNVIESAISYTAGTQIAITYTPLVKGRQIVYNDEEVARISTQTNTLGIISRYESRNDILSNKELEQIGKSYIKYKGMPEVILTLTTQNNNLYNIGEVVYFNSPIEDLSQEYMVKSKKTEYVVIDKIINLFYIYELTSSFNSEKAINYFDNQRNKSQGNIQEGESITRNIDINNLATIIWDNPTITQITITTTGDNTLNSVLNSPFIE